MNFKLLFTFMGLIILPLIGQSNPCTNDVMKFCQNVTPGDRRIGKCLQAHNDHVSSECATFAMNLREQQKTLRQACYGDIAKFCKDVIPGNDRVFTCLEKNSVSAACRSQMKNIMDQVNN